MISHWSVTTPALLWVLQMCCKAFGGSFFFFFCAKRSQTNSVGFNVGHLIVLENCEFHAFESGLWKNKSAACVCNLKVWSHINRLNKAIQQVPTKLLLFMSLVYSLASSFTVFCFVSSIISSPCLKITGLVELWYYRSTLYAQKYMLYNCEVVIWVSPVFCSSSWMRWRPQCCCFFKWGKI